MDTQEQIRKMKGLMKIGPVAAGLAGLAAGGILDNEVQPVQPVKPVKPIKPEEPVEPEEYAEPDVEKVGPRLSPQQRGMVWHPQHHRWVKPEHISGSIGPGKMRKQVRDPFAVATATAQEMGYSDFSEGSEGRKKRDEIAESLKMRKGLSFHLEKIEVLEGLKALTKLQECK